MRAKPIKRTRRVANTIKSILRMPNKMSHHHLLPLTIIIILSTMFINNHAATFCNKTQVLAIDEKNSTSVCVDESEVIENNSIFSKCCPLNYVYDSETHFCEQSKTKRKFGNEFRFFKIGLRDCVENSVVIDFRVEGFENIRMEKTGVWLRNGYHFKHGDYCLDGVYNSDLMVVRGCSESSAECGRSRKCLRKCCPDLEIYVNGAKCKPSADRSFNYKNWSKANQIVTDGCL